MANVSQNIVGGDFYLAFDTAKLAFFSATPISPFFQLDESVGAGTLDYSVAIFPPSYVTGSANIATLKFTALQAICDIGDMVTWRSDPVSRLSDGQGNPVYPTLIDVPPLSDTTPPTVNCPGDFTAECAAPPAYADLAAFLAAGGTVGDNCDTALTLSLTSDTGLVGGACGGTVTRVYRVTDDCGNYAECTQVITVDDTTDPTITCPADFAAECVAPPAYADLAAFLAAGGTASDNCDTELTFALMSETAEGGACGGTVTRVYRVTDDCGNYAECTHVITVDDTTDPTIACPADFAAECVAPPAYADLTAFLAAGGTAGDNCDTALTFTLVSETDVLRSTPCGEAVTRVYRVTDDCGNYAECTQVITVDDTTNPTITCPELAVQCVADIPEAYADLAAFLAAGGTAGDNCDTALTFALISETELVGGACGGTVTRVYRVTDDCDNYAECTQIITVDDTIGPTITDCPDDITVNADAGQCTALVPFGGATATDNCDPAPAITYWIGDTQIASPYIFAGGTTTVTVHATDACGNVNADCSFDVTVSEFNELVVTVQLSPSVVAGPLARCITFELWNCMLTEPEIVSDVLTFTNGVASKTVLVPCARGPFECVTARDKRHTLRRTAEEFDIDGTQYLASFTSDPGSGGDWLIGGNLNDDSSIDILDFGVFSWQWNTAYGTGNTDCNTTYPHADINGNGVVSTEDFTFIQINFLKYHEANCCGQLNPEATEPITRIAVAELVAQGLGELAAGDFNADGWLDEADMALFASGLPPAARYGDLNCDNAVDFNDINPFVQILTSPVVWQQAYPNCNLLNGDVNQDGVINSGDINPFIALLLGN